MILISLGIFTYLLSISEIHVIKYGSWFGMAIIMDFVLFSLLIIKPIIIASIKNKNSANNQLHPTQKAGG